MASTVTVLAPNGRRQTVKCTANTTILQIIEEVCRKQGFKPEEYDIKHHNKVLDTTISFRFSGLPNNAQLELATATKARVDSEIILAMGLEDGSRLVGNFLPDENLHSVLSKLCPNEIKSEHSVVIYMRNEIYGDKLKETTLRSLGLRRGRAMMRLVHKHPSKLKVQANISAPLPSKPVEEKPYHRTLKTESVPLQDQPKETEASKEMQKKQEIDFIKLAKEREKRKLESPNRTAENEVKSPKTRQIEEDKVEVMDVDMPESSNTNSKKTQEKINKNEKSVEESFVFLGERQALLFSLESARSVPAEDLPDDFFELTIDDAKKILGGIRRKQHEMENSVLMTSAMRELEESKKQLRQLNKYKQSIIRVQFPDRTILQGSFKPIETVKDVKDFVGNYLQHPSIDFFLYTTPPKFILDEEKKLLEAGCVPGALLHIGTSSEKIENLSLKSEVRDKFTTNSVASLAASKIRKETTRDLPSVEEKEQDSVETVSDANVAGPSYEPTSYERKVKAPEKVPKWFKPLK